MKNKAEKTPANKKTYYHLILDRSGSMSNCWNQTMSGLQNQFQTIRNLQQENPDQEIFVSVCIFDDVIEFIVPVSPANGDYSHLLRGVQPRSNTALFDAIGDSIRHIELHGGRFIEEKEASVVMVILTDGYENASRRYSGPMIRREIERLRATDLWSFTFLGADFDVTSTADEFNAGAFASMNFSKQNIAQAFQEVDSKMAEYLLEKKEGKTKKDLLN
jgi:hypothetical protein